MPRTCNVCIHQDRQLIELAIVGGEPKRRIATRFGLGEASVRRHASSHLASTLVQSTAARRAAQADELLTEVRHLQKRGLRLLDTAEQQGNLRTALMGIREARSSLDLLAKVRFRLWELEGIITPSELAEAQSLQIEIITQHVQDKGVLAAIARDFKKMAKRYAAKRR